MCPLTAEMTSCGRHLVLQHLSRARHRKVFISPNVDLIARKCANDNMLKPNAVMFVHEVRSELMIHRKIISKVSESAIVLHGCVIIYRILYGMVFGIAFCESDVPSRFALCAIGRFG